MESLHPNSPAAIRAKAAAARLKAGDPVNLAVEGLREMAKADQEDRPALPQGGSGTAQPKPKKEKDKGPQVKYKCGHTVSQKSLEDINCPACRNAARAAKAKKQREQKGAPIPGTGNRSHAEQQGRLPDGARFVCRYEASRTTWCGVLEIPGQPPLEGEASGVERLQRDLSKRAREAGIA